MASKILVIDLVGLTTNVLSQMPRVQSAFKSCGQRSILTPPLPALTCTSQATITTGCMPSEHGIVSNGWYFRETGEVRFWQRSDRLVHGEKIWETARRTNSKLRVANLFWRFCSHSSCDITVTERPTYWANGRKSPDVYTQPGKLRDELVEKLGPFPLFRFWGPATSIESTQWIADATNHVIQTEDPDLTFTYLPHLDYDLQKFGPRSPQAGTAIQQMDHVASTLIDQARNAGRDVMILSEYGISNVEKPIFPNRILRQAGLLSVQHAQNGEILEPAMCRAFAACSHQIAHIYVRDVADVKQVLTLLQGTEGVDRVLDVDQQSMEGIAHARSGELVAIAASNAWFAYPYWLDDSCAPDFARCVAIHDKPGHDPAEMFFGKGGKTHAIRRLAQTKLGMRVPFDVISLDANQICGSHGRITDAEDQQPILLTDWQHHSPDMIPMTAIKKLVLDHLIKSTGND